ncbi:MAG: zf-HC2 domain-containing protein [Gemmatimonadota bacterium]
MDGHLNSSEIQALLDGRLSREEKLVAEGHLGSCGRCRSEYARWTRLFGTLSVLPSLAPPPDLSTRVMDRLAGVRPLVQASQSLPSEGWHPTPEELLDSVDGVAPAEADARLRKHVAACAPCAADYVRWEGLFQAVACLPLSAPSAGFADRVLSRVPAAQPQTLKGRVQLLAARSGAALARIRPRGWAAIAGVATAPAAVAALIVWSLFSNPMVTASALARYASWKVVEWSAVLWRPVASAVAGLAPGQLSALSSPAALVGGFLVFSALTLVALWTLYRNLIPHGSSGGTYARARI